MFRVRAGDPPIWGWVAPGFEAVQQEFRRNFAERGELGAACAVYHRGRKVVDLWGGYRDEATRSPWEEDTLVPVFSGTKGLAAMAVALAHSRGLLDFDERVVVYWPEFAQGGKERITVRQLLGHQAGLCCLDEPLDRQTLSDPDALAVVVARQRPVWEPGTQQGYHAVSLGWYESELIRRVDPRRRSLGRFFRDEIARPLDLEFYIGLPADVPDERLASLAIFSPLDPLFRLDRLSRPFFAALRDPESLTARVFGRRKLTELGQRAYLSLENPAFAGVGQVRSVARAYSAFAAGDGDLGLSPETMAELTAPAVTPSSGPFDAVLQVETCFSLGFMKPCAALKFGGSGCSFGSPGAGGSLGYGDPEAQVGFAYAPNWLGMGVALDPRAMALEDALYGCLEDLGQSGP